MKRFVRFLCDDDGMELLQWAVVLVIAIAIGAVAVITAGSVKTSIEGHIPEETLSLGTP